MTDKLQIARLVEGLEAWAHHIASGYECPAAAQSLLEAAALITKQAEQLNRADGMVAALRDCKSGLEYIRQHYGELSGVGFDRAINGAVEALAEWGE